MATLTKSILPISGYTDQYYTYRCVVTENSYDVANNTSNVTITFSIKGPWAPSFYEWSSNYGILVDGAVKKTGSNSPYVSTSYVTLLTWTGNIAHNADGTKAISVGVYLNNGSANYLPKQYTSSSPLSMGSVTLTTIPRASQPSCITYPNTTNNVGDIGSTIYIHMNRASTSFLHYVYCKWHNKTIEIGKNVASNIQWQIPYDFLNDIPTETQGWGTIYVKTYNGDKLIGEKSVKFTATVASNVVPTVGAITLDPVNITTKDGVSRNILIQGKNKLTVSASGCTAGTGSSIKSYTFSGPGVSSTTTATSTTSSGTISNTGSLTYTVTVTDKRGRTASKTATISCYPYFAPSFTTFSAYRANSNGTSNPDGKYLKCTYSTKHAEVNNTNSVSVTAYYTTGTTTKSATGNNGSVLVNLNENSKTYQVRLQIVDNYNGTGTSSVITVFGSTRTLNITQDGTGFAIGKLADQNEYFDVRWKSQFRNDVVVDGNLIAPGVQKVVEFYTGSTAGTIQKTLSAGDNIDNYKYLEILYTDNNNNGHNSVKIYSPNGRLVDLSLIEVADSTATRTYIRRTLYTVAGDGNTLTITPSSAARGYVRIDGTTITETKTDQNYIKIIKVLGYR